MAYRLVVEVVKMNNVLALVEFALNLGASVKIETKIKTEQGADTGLNNDQKED